MCSLYEKTNMKTNQISPVFAEFNSQITQIQQQTNKPTVQETKKEEKVLNKKVVNSLIAMGIIGIASLGIHLLSTRRKVKTKYQAPVPKFTAPPPAMHLGQEQELYMPSIKPIKSSTPIKESREYIDECGRKVIEKAFPSGSIEETFNTDGRISSRRILQTIKRADGFCDELDVFSYYPHQNVKKIIGERTRDVGYSKLSIQHEKEFIKDSKGKYRLIRRQKVQEDDVLNPIHKIVEHLEDGTTRITIQNVSNYTQDIITRDRKGNILSKSFTFL